MSELPPGCQPNDCCGDPSAHIDAAEAKCTRCGTVIMDEASWLGAVVGSMQIASNGQAHDFQLCGKCGLAAREFLFPHIADSPTYKAIKSQLMELWS